MSNSLMLQGNVMQLQLPFDFVKINFGIVMIRSLTVMIIVVPRLAAARAVALGVTPPLQLLIKALCLKELYWP